MRYAILASMALLGVTGAAACASNRTPAPMSWTDTATPPSVTVQNDNWLDVVVYVVRGASRFRIGTVAATSSATFKLSPAAAGFTPVQVLADPIGSSARYMTDPVVIGPGQRLELRVGSPINISSYSIWNR
jgi:hypothetical protein